MGFQREEIKYIIRAEATKLARPDYFYATSDGDLTEMVSFLAENWYRIKYRKIENKDERLEGILRNCALGGERQRINLQAYYNQQNGTEHMRMGNYA